MDNEPNICSKRPVVEAPSCSRSPNPSTAEGIKTYPFCAAAQATGSENNTPPYTDGPSRIIFANDGTKPCLAVLLTPSLVAALNQITHDTHELSRRSGTLERITSELTDLSSKADNVDAAMRNPRYQDRAEEMQLALEILHLKQQEAKERKNQLHLDLAHFEARLKSSRYHSQAIFEEALREARLLDPSETVVSVPLIPDVDDDDGDDDDEDTLAGYYSDAPSAYEGTEPTPEQHKLREARMDVIGSYDALRNSQARFDDRHAEYERKLAVFRHTEAESEDTRTLFDHRYIQHVRGLTRDLMAAEQGYRSVKGMAKALEMPVDKNDVFDPDDDERRRDGVITRPDTEGRRIEVWRRGVVVPERGIEIVGNGERVDLDEWDARPVEIMDSVSVVDRDEYKDEIKEWKKHCDLLREEASTGLS